MGSMKIPCFLTKKDVVDTPEVVHSAFRLDPVFLHGRTEIDEHLEGVLEDDLPEDLSALVIGQGVVHGVGVQRGHIRFDGHDRGDSLFRRDPWRDGRAHVDDQLRAAVTDGVDGLPDLGDIRGRIPGLGIPGVDVDNGRAGLPALERLFRKLLGGIGDPRVLLLPRGGPGQGGADDHFIHMHSSFPEGGQLNSARREPCDFQEIIVGGVMNFSLVPAAF